MLDIQCLYFGKLNQYRSPSSKEVLSDESSAEIIEVGGAWRTSASQSEGGEDVEIPLDDMELIRGDLIFTGIFMVPV